MRTMKVYQFHFHIMWFSLHFPALFERLLFRKKINQYSIELNWITSLPFVWALLLCRLRGAFLGTAGRHLPVSASSRSKTCGRHARSHMILHPWLLEAWDSPFRLVCLQPSSKKDFLRKLTLRPQVCHIWHQGKQSPITYFYLGERISLTPLYAPTFRRPFTWYTLNGHCFATNASEKRI